ncbi:MAG: hypothetical protein WC569_02225 [Candidatus Omnitrophota bacterium]
MKMRFVYSFKNIISGILAELVYIALILCSAYLMGFVFMKLFK